MSKLRLTKKQQQVADFLSAYVVANGSWPSYREITDHFGFKSPNSVTQNLKALEKKGYLVNDQHGYRLVVPSRAPVETGFRIVGIVENGNYRVALSIDEIVLLEQFPNLKSAFAIQVSQKVSGVDVSEGDYLLLQETEIRDGQLAAVLLRNEPIVCRLFVLDDMYRIQYLDGREVYVRSQQRNCRILGRYVGHINQRGLYHLPTRFRDR